MNRAEAADIFSMRLDHLGFMNYIIVLSVIITILVVIPFLATCCKSGRGGGNYLFSSYEPYIARAIFVVIFASMLYIVNEERGQSRDNLVKVAKFNKTNDCGDDYSKVNTQAVTLQLGQAEARLDGMEISLIVALGLIILESGGLCIYRFCCGVPKK